MAATPAVDLLVRSRVTFELHEYTVDGDAVSYGKAAAAALGVEPARVFKTLICAIDDRPAVAVVPVTADLDLKAWHRSS